MAEGGERFDASEAQGQRLERWMLAGFQRCGRWAKVVLVVVALVVAASQAMVLLPF